MTKALNNNDQTYLITVKVTHPKPTVHFILSVENLMYFLKDQEGDKGAHFPFFFSKEPEF